MPVTQPTTTPAGLAPPEVLRHRITNYTILRILLATGLFGLVVFLVMTEPSTVLNRMRFFTLVIVTYSVLGTSLALLPRIQAIGTFVIVQLVFDAALITALVAMTGGPGSIFFVLYFMNIVAGAYLGYSRATLATALLDVGFFILLVTATESHYIEGELVDTQTETYAEILLRISGFILVGALTGRLAERVQVSDSALHRQRETTRALAEEYQLIVQSVRSGILVVDPDGRITGANPAADETLGASTSHLLVDTLPDLQRGADRQEILVQGPAGLRNILCHRAPLGTDGAEVVVFDDVTQLRLMEAEIEREERLVGVGKIAAAIAHEIRNPLASLSGAIQLLADERPGPLLDIALREVRRLDELVGDFLEVARAPRIYPRPTQVMDVVQTVCASFRRDPRYNETTSVEASGDPGGPFVIDPNRLQQILWNLLLNGAQSMAEGGTLTIEVERKLLGLCIRVRDQGQGIPEAERGKLFDPFHTTRRGGTGLGLVTVERLVKAHDGTIGVKSGLGEGTTFELFFPEKTNPGALPPTLGAT